MSTARTPLGVIREHCLYCSGQSSNEVKLCQVTKCPLYDWRFGSHPYVKRTVSESRREIARQNFAAKQNHDPDREKNSPNEDFQAIRGAES